MFDSLKMFFGSSPKNLPYVATLTLGLRPRQRLAKVQAKSEA
jgi:hypothetical protein